MSITEENLKYKEKIFIPFDVEDVGLSICPFRIYSHLSNPTEVVNICASCHCEFHFLTDKKIFKLIERRDNSL
ncbi:MAG: hypothetical protein MET45_24085 [Nostoc sp. LLA-1]|nr:hypothetical protein [Cyanocohniella sp. LLY]